MIFVNDKLIDTNNFPDHTTFVRLAPDMSFDNKVELKWLYDNDAECMTVMYLTRHLQQMGHDVELVMPYVPNARQDRVKEDEDVFTLKYFAEFINNLFFTKVTVFDAHSIVTDALIDRIVDERPAALVTAAIENIWEEEKTQPFIFFPDEGASKRYVNLIKGPCGFGIKKRDWKTGQLADEMQLYGDIPDDLEHAPVLIIDDICSRGGTFVRAAKALRNRNAGRIYLCVSHCENTIHDGALLKDGFVKKVYTTDSIYRGKSEDVVICKKYNLW
ncbi:ribose-phosphate pyrophosphokinase [bacterium]|nr:ribose-phosphate pyrophosphokinase [bacterium]